MLDSQVKCTGGFRALTKPYSCELTDGTKLGAAVPAGPVTSTKRCHICQGNLIFFRKLLHLPQFSGNNDSGLEVFDKSYMYRRDKGLHLVPGTWGSGSGLGRFPKNCCLQRLRSGRQSGTAPRVYNFSAKRGRVPLQRRKTGEMWTRRQGVGLCHAGTLRQPCHVGDDV